jgi:hypothetical protein
MKKAELEAHHNEYRALESRISSMAAARQFPGVFSACIASFPHIVPALKYRKQEGIQPEIPDLLSFDVVCKYGPVLFEHAVLETLHQFVQETRMLARHTNGYLDAIRAALQREEIARKIWNLLQAGGEVPELEVCQRVAINRATLIEIVGPWELLRVVVRTTSHNGPAVRLRSYLTEKAEGVCQACGIRAKGRKEAFFSRVRCTRCGATGYYHIRYADSF